MLEIGSKMLNTLAIVSSKSHNNNSCRHYWSKNGPPNSMQEKVWKYIIDVGYWLYNDLKCSAQDSHKPGRYALYCLLMLGCTPAWTVACHLLDCEH